MDKYTLTKKYIYRKLHKVCSRGCSLEVSTSVLGCILGFNLFVFKTNIALYQLYPTNQTKNYLYRTKKD